MMKQKHEKKNERGIAMMIAMMVLLFMAIIGVGFMFMADTENSVNNNYRDSQRAYFASRAGLENVRVLLQPGAPSLGIPSGPLYAKAMALDGKMPNGTQGVMYVFNPSSGEAIDMTKAPYLDDELCQEQFASLNTTLGYNSVTKGVPCGSPTNSAYYTDITSSLNINSGNPAGSDIPYTTTSGAVPFKWVRITNKQDQMGLVAGPLNFVDGQSANSAQQVCYDGTKEFTTATTCQPGAQPVWLLTSMAVTPSFGNRPGSKRMTQMEVALSPSIYPPGVVSTEAPLDFNGSSVTINALDNCSCDPTGCTLNSLTGVTSCNTRATSPVACNKSAVAAYTSGTINTNGNPVAITGFGNNLSASTTTQGGASTTGVQPWPFNISDLINSYKASAVMPSWASQCTGTSNVTAVPPVYEACGKQGGVYGTYPQMDSTGVLTNSSTLVPQTTYIPGSVHFAGQGNQNLGGSGVLIVDGDLQIDSGFEYYGLILVRGQVTFSGGGSTATNIFGAILAGGDVNNSCKNSDLNLCTDTIGGGVNLHYDRCALARGQSYAPPRLLATHEIQY